MFWLRHTKEWAIEWACAYAADSCTKTWCELRCAMNMDILVYKMKWAINNWTAIALDLGKRELWDKLR